MFQTCEEFRSLHCMILFDQIASLYLIYTIAKVQSLVANNSRNFYYIKYYHVNVT